MMDRNRSSIHIVMSGVIGLMLGLFVAWWVWPVEWTQPTAPAGQPAASAPAQAGGAPIEGGAEGGSSYSPFLDWVNQGLLILAAALLLVGGVVIGYQLLRQSQDGETAARSATRANAQEGSRQAAVPRGQRAVSAVFRASLFGRQSSLLSWLRRARSSYGGADIDEPVFQSHPETTSGPAERTAHPRHMQRGAVPLQDRGAETYQPSDQIDDMLATGTLPVSKPDWAYSPPESSYPNESEPEPPATPGMTDTAGLEIIEGQATQEGEGTASWQEDDQPSDRPVVDQVFDGEAGESVPDSARALAEDAAYDVDDIQEAATPWEESRQPPSIALGTAGGREDKEAESGGNDEGIQATDPATSHDWPAQPIDGVIDSIPSVAIESEVDATPSSQFERAAEAQTTGEPTDAFEANYAFGIQSYDESFTITARTAPCWARVAWASMSLWTAQPPIRARYGCWKSGYMTVQPCIASAGRSSLPALMLPA